MNEEEVVAEEGEEVVEKEVAEREVVRGAVAYCCCSAAPCAT